MAAVIMLLPTRNAGDKINVLTSSEVIWGHFRRFYNCCHALILGMWNDVRLTEHHLQIRASDIKVHNRWLNLHSSTSDPSFIARWSYRITHRVAHAVKKAAKLNILFTLQLTQNLAWENVTTDIIHGRRACSFYRPGTVTVSAIIRRSAE